MPARPVFAHARARQSSGTGAGLSPLVNFYSKLPKGPAPTTTSGGIKARYFNGKNASAAPLLFTILGIFGLGYTIDYQSASSVVISHTNELTLSEPLIVHLSTSYHARLPY